MEGGHAWALGWTLIAAGRSLFVGPRPLADAQAMNCHDVREEFSASSRGGMALTERALVHAHVAQCVDCRKERESLQLVVSSPRRAEPSGEPSNFGAWLTRLRMRLSISLTGSAQAAVRVIDAARAGAERAALGLLTRVRWLLPMVWARSARGAASLIGHVRFGITRFAHRLICLRSSLMIACRGATRVAIEAARAGVARIVDLPTRVRWPLPLLLTRSVQAAASLIGRVHFMSTRLAHLLVWLRSSVMIACRGAARATIEAASAGVTQVLASLTRLRVLVSISFTGAIGITRHVGRIVVTTSGRALSHLGARTSALRQRKAAWVGTGIVSLAVLGAAMMLLWPRQWPDNLMDPAELAVPAPVARTPAPVPVSARQAAPAGVSRPETARGAMQQRPGEARDEILVPVRRPAPAPLPSTEATQNGEASDPAAAIDWLLKGGSSRRHSQSP